MLSFYFTFCFFFLSNLNWDSRITSEYFSRLYPTRSGRTLECWESVRRKHWRSSMLLVSLSHSSSIQHQRSAKRTLNIAREILKQSTLRRQKKLFLFLIPSEMFVVMFFVFSLVLFLLKRKEGKKATKPVFLSRMFRCGAHWIMLFRFSSSDLAKELLGWWGERWRRSLTFVV